MNEAEAIACLKQGDPQGLKALVEAYQTEAVRVAYLICRDNPLAEDVVQAAFIKAYDRRDTYDARRPFAPWFMRMVANDAVKAVKRRSREVHYPEERDGPAIDLAALADEAAPDPARLAEESELRQTVWEAIGRLTPQQRRAIVLRYYLDLRETEVAQRMGRAPSTIKRLLHDARDQLRGLLRQQG